MPGPHRGDPAGGTLLRDRRGDILRHRHPETAETHGLADVDVGHQQQAALRQQGRVLRQQDDRLATHDVLWQQVRALPPRQRTVLVLRYYEDLSEADIAEVLGCSRGTVKSQAAKGLSRLRHIVEKENARS